jgi:hypothetical protein
LYREIGSVIGSQSSRRYIGLLVWSQDPARVGPTHRLQRLPQLNGRHPRPVNAHGLMVMAERSKTLRVRGTTTSSAARSHAVATSMLKR